jgi:hypothetical protein
MKLFMRPPWLSPLLSNIILDELDKELEKREHSDEIILTNRHIPVGTYCGGVSRPKGRLFCSLMLYK